MKPEPATDARMSAEVAEQRDLDLIVQRPEGLYCPQGDFYIDPWRPVERAVVTHAHADHARPGHRAYLAAAPAEGVLRARLGADLPLQTVPYGERLPLPGGVTLSLHPAGHVLGSAQVRIAWRGRVWVASGDYKVAPDASCAAFEPQRCEVFVTESTFGLPVYRWRPDAELFAAIAAWWAANAAAGRASLLGCYSFGKAQRILAALDASAGPIVVHGALEPINAAYRAAGVRLAPVRTVAEVEAAEGARAARALYRRALVLAPPAALAGAWARRFGADAQTALASGWMLLRGARRRGGYDRGFALSDHADWPGLLDAVAATGCERVIVTHGSVAVLVRYLREQRGLRAESFATEYGDEALEAPDGATEGATERSTEGATQGATDGAAEGATDGATGGATEGRTEGATEGGTKGGTEGAAARAQSRGAGPAAAPVEAFADGATAGGASRSGER
jgi:putative mRNA 3-end processing factor